MDIEEIRKLSIEQMFEEIKKQGFEIYRQAYNKGLEDAAEICKSVGKKAYLHTPDQCEREIRKKINGTS